MKSGSRGLKNLPCLMVWVLLVLSIVGNAGGEGTSLGSNSTPKRQLRTLIVADYYPYTFVNKEGIPDGFSVDLIKAVTKVMGMDLEIGVDSWERARRRLETGDIDILPMMAYSKERHKDFDFSVPHTIAYDAFFARKDHKRLETIEDLKGKTIIVMKGDQAHDYLRSSGFADTEHLILVESLPEALRLLASGKGDAALMPKLVGLMVMKDLNLTNLAPSPVVVESYSRPFSFAVKEGSQSLLERLSQGLTIVKKTGQYSEIYEKWFGALEPKEMSLKSVLKYIVGALLALLLIGAAFAVWTVSLKKQVTLRTTELTRANDELQSQITERKRAEEALRESEERFRSIFETSVEGMFRSTPEGRFIAVNPALANIHGYGSPEEMVAEVTDIGAQLYVHREDLERYRDLLGRHGVVKNFEVHGKRRDGSKNWVSLSTRAIRDSGGSLLCYQGVVVDITEKKRAVEVLRESEERFRLLYENSSDGIVHATPEGKMLAANPAACRMFGRTEEELRQAGRASVVDLSDPRVEAALEERERTGMFRSEYFHIRKDGTRFLCEVTSNLFRDKDGQVRTSVILRDITERKRAEEEKEKLQAQLLQAQKMESVGRLAGGVAHDFNNMLGIIIGNAEMAALQVDPEGPVHLNLQEIIKASHRSADTVRQLLAFARKQTIAPKILDLNDTVSGMLKMLQRLIGEDIDLAWLPGHELRKVKVDSSQVNQILANLVVNARDAISGVGKVTIETANVQFDESDCREHPDCIRGEYVLLAVSDTGSGISREVMENLFDPFFTTKEVGKGTGLGLATVYGIVKQNNGFINVHSVPGQGTAFKIYFPRCGGETSAVHERVEGEIPTGTETVLIAEDESSLLRVARDILTKQGYTVLPARTPTEALALAEKHTGEIQLLLTDVVMPEMNGRELREKLHTRRPGMKSLFMSGYTANVVAHHGVLDEGVDFIEKPFSPRVLAEKVREVLDSPEA